MRSLKESLYMAWIIGAKDIADALKNKSTRANIVVMIGMVVFFYWFGTLRPFDKDVSAVVYDEGHTSLTLDRAELKSGATYRFRKASSLLDMETKMAHQTLGLVLPADLDQSLASNVQPTLEGYIFWVDRKRTTQLEAQYSQAVTEIVGQPVEVSIGQNIVIPQADTGGMQAYVAHWMVFYMFWTALTLIPPLMLEERHTKTLEALMTSPASPGQIVLGKALAGLFYVLVVGGLAVALNRAYVVHWGLAAESFLIYALFAVGLALAVGSFIRSAQQWGIWGLVLILFLVVPSLFYMEPTLKPGIRNALRWFPSAAVASLFRLACSTGATAAHLWPNLAVSALSIAAVFGLVIWKVRRSDR